MRITLGCGEAGLDFAGVMRVVVKNLHAVFFADQLKATPGEVIFGQPRGTLLDRHAKHVGGNQCGGQRVLCIVQAGHVQCDAPQIFAAMHHVKTGRAQCVVGNVADGIIAVTRQAVSNHAAFAVRDDFARGGIIGIGKQHAVLGQQSHKCIES